MPTPWFDSLTLTNAGEVLSETPRAPLSRTEVTVHRQPVVRPDRSVLGYAVSVVVRASLMQADRGDELDALVHAEYEELDRGGLAGPNVAFVRATAAMLTSDWPLPETPGGLVLEVPSHFAARPDAARHLVRLREAGLGLALADYVPGGIQDTLLALVDFVKVDLGRGEDLAVSAIERAHGRTVAVIAERVDSERSVLFCLTQGVELLQGPLFQRDTSPVPREFTAGELQCFQLLQLLAADDVDNAEIVRIIGTDPELTIRVLHQVNSSAFALRARIDSVRQAVVLLGPEPLRALAASSLVSADSSGLAGLWFVLTRAVACRSIAGADAAYTVGLLSAVASQLRIAPVDLIERAGVSDDVGNALLTLSGPFGSALAAVLAHEENNIGGVEVTGLAQFDVAHAYLDAVADALGTVTSLAGHGGMGAVG